ncbi:hypothetical protein BJX99DRAFT_265799 [Aspergillus californicus]
MQRCQLTTILTSRAHLQIGKKLQGYAASHGVQTSILHIQFTTSPVIHPQSPLMNMNPEMKISPDRPALLLFTSGTSGPPKSVKGGVTVLIGPPRFWGSLMSYFQTQIAQLPSEDLCDELATKADDGCYRTGDIAHRVGEDYIFDGRIGKFIKFKGYKIPILELEMHLLALPFISDACVLPVTDATSNERVAATWEVYGAEGALWLAGECLGEDFDARDELLDENVLHPVVVLANDLSVHGLSVDHDEMDGGVSEIADEREPALVPRMDTVAFDDGLFPVDGRRVNAEGGSWLLVRPCLVLDTVGELPANSVDVHAGPSPE